MLDEILKVFLICHAW